jgi:hypothetical protein
MNSPHCFAPCSDIPDPKNESFIYSAILLREELKFSISYLCGSFKLASISPQKSSLKCIPYSSRALRNFKLYLQVYQYGYLLPGSATDSEDHLQVLYSMPRSTLARLTKVIIMSAQKPMFWSQAPRATLHFSTKCGDIVFRLFHPWRGGWLV